MNINPSSSVSESISWVGKWTFVLAAAGSAVGLGNIWGFPYKAGTEGGSAFVLIYLGCILVVGLPIMMAEIMIGRRARKSPVNAMKIAAIDSGQSSKWQAVGWGGLVSGILILSFYSVIAGICLNYIGIAAMPNTSISSVEQFNLVTASAPRLLFWHTVFIGFNIAILAAGVIGGIERMVRLLMPTLFVLMIIMVINAMINGDFIRGLSFLFSPNFSDVDATTFLRAMGQAFFSLSLGMGSIMCYGSYMPKEENIFKTSLTVAGLDTLIAILAGLAIFPIIFAYGMEPEAGPGLVFISLLSVFVDMPFGNILGPAFFTLLSIAALSSAISLLEPSVAYFEEEKISLDAFLIKNKEATFYAKASGNSMINAGINDGDILVIDRSLPVTNNKIAICFVDGEFTVKRIAIQEDKILLLPENPNYKPIEISKENEFVVWGIVTYVIKKLT